MRCVPGRIIVNMTRTISLFVALAGAVLLIGWLGLEFGGRALAGGIGLVCLGWILHDDSRRPPDRRDSLP